MRGLIVSFLLCAVASTMGASAMSAADFMPHRFQTGSMYKEAVASSSLKKSTVGDIDRFVNTTENFMEQLIDHTDPSRGTFQQRFYVDFTYWDGKGPAALYISGEQIAKGSPSGFLQDYAQSINGLLFTLEHRWYGNSALSTNYSDMSLMSTLTIENALADMNAFMNFIDAKWMNGNNLTWYSVGGSYAGGLSAWLKTVYPDRIKAAWSSSGVTNPKFDYWQYEGHVVSVLPPLCVYSLQQVYQQVYLRWDDAADFAALQAQFGVANMTKTEFAEMLADAYAGPVQYGNKEALCDAMVPLQPDAIAQFAAVNAQLNGVEHGARFLAYRNPRKAAANNNKMIRNAADTDMSGWLWNFQCCSQMAFWQIGYPAIGTQGTCIRPEMIDTDYYMDVCARDYGANFFPDVWALHKTLGGAFPPATSVIALQGSDDPFAPAGVNSQVNEEYPYVLAQCDGCGHCGDLYAQKPTDPANKVLQREMIVQYMNKWLGFVNNVTFSTAAGATKPSIQSALLTALAAVPQQQTWLSALVYSCNAAGTECYASFTNATVAATAMRMANNGTIAGVTGAFYPSPSDDDSGSGLSRGTVIGIVLGCVMAFFVAIAIVAIVIRKRQKDQAVNGYHNVNEDTLH